MDEAYEFVKSQVQEGKIILFVGTKNKLKRQSKKKQKDVVCTISIKGGLVDF